MDWSHSLELFSDTGPVTRGQLAVHIAFAFSTYVTVSLCGGLRLFISADVVSATGISGAFSRRCELASRDHQSRRYSF